MEQILDYMIKDEVLLSNEPKSIFDFSDFALKEAETYEKIVLLQHELENLQTISDGWSYPLTNFMNERQLLECIHLWTITMNGKSSIFSVPITCSVNEEDYNWCNGKEGVTFVNENGEILGFIWKPSFYLNRQEEICARVLGTLSANHPKSQLILAEKKWLLTGSNLTVVKRVLWNDDLDQYWYLPSEIKQIAEEKKADVLYGF